MSNLIDNEDGILINQFAKRQNNINSGQFLFNIVSLLFEQFTLDSNSGIIIDHIQIINIPQPTFHYPPSLYTHINDFEIKINTYQIIMNVFSKRSNLKYQILIDLCLQYYILTCEKFNTINMNSSINDYLIFSSNSKINNYNLSTLNMKWSDRQSIQFYNLIKNFNKISTTNCNNLSLYLSPTNNLCLHLQKMLVFTENFNSNKLRKQYITKVLKPQLRSSIQIMIDIFQLPFLGAQIVNLNKQNLQNSHENSSLISNFQQNKNQNQSQSVKQSLNAKKDYKQIIQQLYMFRKSFLKSHEVKIELQKCNQSIQMLQKSIKVLLPSFQMFKNNYNQQVSNKNYVSQIQKQNAEKQFYELTLSNYKKIIDQNQQNHKTQLKNKMVHGIILINQNYFQNINQSSQSVQSQRSQQQSKKKKKQKLTSTKSNNKLPVRQSKKSENQISWIEDSWQQSQLSSSYSQKSIQGGGQSSIKRIKQHVFLINTIFHLRKSYQQIKKQRIRNNTQPLDNKGKKSSNTIQNFQQMQKIQICQFFAQKAPLIYNNSSIQSFCTQYTFLMQHPDYYCNYVSNYYLDVQAQKNQKKIIQRKIYSKWEKGDVYQLLYKKLQQGSKIPVSSNILLCIGRQMSESLCFMNKIKIVHRDIKLSNFLLSKYMTVKLTDFGSCHPQFYSLTMENNPSYAYINQNNAKQQNGQYQISNQKMKNYSKKMRTSYGLTYNSRQLLSQIKNKYSKEQFNCHANFDIYCFGLVIKELIYKNLHNNKVPQIIQNLQFLYQNSLMQDPSFRLMAYEIFIMFIKIMQLNQKYEQYTNQKVNQIIVKKKDSQHI